MRLYEKAQPMLEGSQFQAKFDFLSGLLDGWERRLSQAEILSGADAGEISEERYFLEV